MLKIYKREKDVITVVTTDKFKEVTITSPNLGAICYRSPIDETTYGSMGSYIDSWLKAVEGLKPVVVMA